MQTRETDRDFMPWISKQGLKNYFKFTPYRLRRYILKEVVIFSTGHYSLLEINRSYEPNFMGKIKSYFRKSTVYISFLIVTTYGPTFALYFGFPILAIIGLLFFLTGLVIMFFIPD